MWVFLATEVMFFGGLFAGYMVYRFTIARGVRARPAASSTSRSAAINTAVLLTSSLTMALAVHAGQTGDRKAAGPLPARSRWSWAPTFLGIKAYEYYEEYEKHLVPGPHFSTRGSRSRLRLDRERRAELLRQRPRGRSADAALLRLLLLHDRPARRCTWSSASASWPCIARAGPHAAGSRPEYHTPLEMAGLYWHFVDIVWVFLFPLLYLIDLHK